MSIGDNIRKYRKEKHLTQNDLAELIGVHEVTIRGYESNKYTPKHDKLVLLAEKLGVNLSDLYKGTLLEDRMQELETKLKAQIAAEGIFKLDPASEHGAYDQYIKAAKKNQNDYKKEMEFLSELGEIIPINKTTDRTPRLTIGEEEETVISMMQNVNSEGKGRIIEYAEMISQMPHYQTKKPFE